MCDHSAMTETLQLCLSTAPAKESIILSKTEKEGDTSRIARNVKILLGEMKLTRTRQTFNSQEGGGEEKEKGKEKEKEIGENELNCGTLTLLISSLNPLDVLESFEKIVTDC